jgi:hypothetical protein
LTSAIGPRSGALLCQIRLIRLPTRTPLCVPQPEPPDKGPGLGFRFGPDGTVHTLRDLVFHRASSSLHRQIFRPARPPGVPGHHALYHLPGQPAKRNRPSQARLAPGGSMTRLRRLNAPTRLLLRAGALSTLLLVGQIANLPNLSPFSFLAGHIVDWLGSPHSLPAIRAACRTSSTNSAMSASSGTSSATRSASSSTPASVLPSAQ